MENHLITICARGGSKGIPGKNIRPLNGKPLIAYTIDVSKQLSSDLSIDIGLSTDSKVIRDVAKDCGLDEDYLRPEELAGDETGKIAVINDLLRYYENKMNKEYDYIWDLDVTSPLRNKKDLLESYRKLKSRPEAYNIFSVSPANKNPYFNMVEETGDGYVKLILDDMEFRSRQKAPKVYDMNASIYIFRRKFFEEGFTMSNTPKSLFYLVPHLCFDLDYTYEFTIMELLMREGLLDFEL